MFEILLAVAVLTGIVLTLSSLILIFRAWMIGSGAVEIEVNQSRAYVVRTGNSLLNALNTEGLAIPAVCGGRGTCGQCRVTVLEGGGPVRPAEQALISRAELQNRIRLACQITVREKLRLRVPDNLFGVRRWRCRVRSNENVATFIKEVVLEFQEGEEMEFRAGEYILVECPPYQTTFRDFEIASPFREEWDRLNLWRYSSRCMEKTQRAYSLANYPAEPGAILNVRIATPPPGAPSETPAGIVSSYLFSRKPGDTLTVSGPYGTFQARESDREMVLLGGGAGMAPMRSHILDQLERLKRPRRIVFWYGARSRKELFYVDLFDRLAAEHDNFNWQVVLSDVQPEDRWTGLTGFLHEAVYEHYLKDHPEPENCEYYICGPPMMNEAVLRMLDDLGVDENDIFLDDFGA